MKTDSFFPAFSSRLFRKWFGILDHALYVFKAFRTQFDCHAIFVGNIERKFDAGVYGLFIAESRIVVLNSSPYVLVRRQNRIPVRWLVCVLHGSRLIRSPDFDIQGELKRELTLKR